MKIHIGKIGSVMTMAGGVLMADAAIKYSRKLAGKLTGKKGTFKQNLIESTIAAVIMTPTTILAGLNWAADQKFNTSPKDENMSHPEVLSEIRSDIVKTLMDMVYDVSVNTDEPDKFIESIKEIRSLSSLYPINIVGLDEMLDDIIANLYAGDMIKASTGIYNAAQLAATTPIHIINDDESGNGPTIARPDAVLDQELASLEGAVINGNITPLEAMDKLIDIGEKFHDDTSRAIIDAFTSKIASIAESKKQ